MDNNKLKKLFNQLEPYLQSEEDKSIFNSWKNIHEENEFFTTIREIPQIAKLSAMFDKLSKGAEETLLSNYDLDETTRLYLFAYKDIAKRFARSFATVEKSNAVLEENIKQLKEKMAKDINLEE